MRNVSRVVIIVIFILAAKQASAQGVIETFPKVTESDSIILHQGNSATQIFTNMGPISYKDLDSIRLYFKPSELFETHLRQSKMPYRHSRVTLEELKILTNVDFKKEIDWLVTVENDTLYGNVSIARSKAEVYNFLNGDFYKVKNKNVLSYKKEDRIYENHEGFKRVELKGYVSVFSVEVVESNGTYGGPYGISTGGGIRTYRYYYLKKADSEVLTFIMSSKKSKRKERDFKKKAADYFKDCPRLAGKISNIYNSNRLKEIVEFYNTDCRN